MDTDEFNPFDDEEAIELLCSHYNNLHIEAYHERKTSLENISERRFSWAEMVEEEEANVNTSVNVEEWPTDIDPTPVTLIPLKRVTSRLCLPFTPTEDEELTSEELVPETEEYEEEYELDETEEEEEEGIYPLRNYCVIEEEEEEEEDNIFDKEKVDNTSKTNSPSSPDTIRFNMLFLKPVDRKTSLKDLVILRAASRSAKHALYSKCGNEKCDLGEDYKRKRRLLEVWDCLISGYILDL